MFAGLALLTIVAQAGDSAGVPGTGPAASVAAPSSPAGIEQAFLSDEDLSRLAAENVDAARPFLRRTARSSPAPASRLLALRLLAAHDPSAPTVRICARALRLDDDPLARRAAAECLGRLPPPLASSATPALLAALKDPSIDVMTMAGWALANVGDTTAVGPVAEGTKHPDARVAATLRTSYDRLLARLGLASARAAPVAGRDEQGRGILPPGSMLVGTLRSLDTAASVAWLGAYGASLGWYHGSYLLAAHGGPDAPDSAGLAGLTGAAVGAALASTYALSRADGLPLAHTVVQLGMFGTLAGYGAGRLTGFPPSASIHVAHLSLAGTIAGTAVGVALVETRPPTVGALGAGLVTGLAAGVATGSLWAGYRLAPRFSSGVAALAGATTGAVTTLGAANVDIGLFPIAGSLLGTLLGAGGGAALFLGPGATLGNETAGWGIAGSTVAGAALGALTGLVMPRSLDPLLQEGLRLPSATIATVDDGSGGAAPIFAVAGVL